MSSILRARLTGALFLLLACFAAHATTSDVSDNGFVVTVKRDVIIPLPQLYAAILHVERWWSDEHTWSGVAKNLSLDARAGGCFCERWQDNSIEHARVINVMRNRLLRLAGALGPLQALGVSGVLDFALSDKTGVKTLTVTYRVAGANANLGELAPAVDRVITQQIDRLIVYANSKERP